MYSVYYIYIIKENSINLNKIKEYIDKHENMILIIDTMSFYEDPPFYNFQVYNSSKYCSISALVNDVIIEILNYTKVNDISFPRTIKGMTKEWREHNLGFLWYSFLGDFNKKYLENAESGKHVDFDTSPETLEQYE